MNINFVIRQYLVIILCYSHVCTEQLIYITALSKLQESAEISAVRYTNLNGSVPKPNLIMNLFFHFIFAFPQSSRVPKVKYGIPKILNWWPTMNYPKKPGFNMYQSRHCAYITYSVKTWFLKNLSVLHIQYTICYRW